MFPRRISCLLYGAPSHLGDYTAEEWNEEHKRFIVNKDIMLEVVVEVEG